MKLNGSLTLLGGGQIKTLTVENLATDPASPALAGRIWYNTGEASFKGYTGTEVVNLGRDAELTAEVDNMQTALGGGINASDGTYVAPSGTNYIDGGGSYRGEALLLDAQIKINEDNIASNDTDISNIQTEIGNIETSLGAGVDGDGVYVAPRGTNYLDGAGSYRAETLALDVQSKANADNIATNTADIATNSGNIANKVAKAGDTMTGNLNMGSTNKIVSIATPTDNGDAATKGYVDALVAGLDFQADVHGLQTDATLDPGATPTVDDRYVITDSTSLHANFGTITGLENNDVVQFDGTDFVVAYDVSEKGEGAILWNRAEDSFYLYAGGIWSSFGGLAGITAGAGLGKSGNEIWVNFGAGIKDSPNDEVGIDPYANGGLFTTEDGTTESTTTAAQLAVKLNGNSLNVGVDGLKVADSGITESHLNTSVVGNGLSGGAGTALAINPSDTSLTVDGTGVSVNTTWADARYATLSGATMTGTLVLSGDPVDVNDAANKNYVDAEIGSVSTKIDDGNYIYTAGAAATTHTITHGIGQQYVNVTVVDSNDQVVIPDSITFDSTTQLTVSFLSSVTCKVVCQGVKTA